nr:MAG TPA: hypothetical protein [Caudoviricetes sp.]
MASYGNLWQVNLKYLLLILLRVPGEARGSRFKILLTNIITHSMANYG